ncbi:serine/threonine-protein kinase [Actinokineospora bangkokensis]|uniref:serine/threonine-protein kinase n=1 Tax=Actinokineospora bangkokensis TaxID=1193682 RepID=UPI000B176805|nr:serine/threonine-protein kinase [Actinokineospora bangkokensis]
MELVAGRYRLVEPLGVGSTADVHLAHDTLLDRPVALKLLTGTAEIADPRRFANEVRALSGLSHPNLVQVLDAGTDGRTPYVVLSLVRGRTLSSRLVEEGRLEVAEVRHLGALLADVLAHVHERGVVHRDVKPSNILLDHDEQPHLADFGLALLTGGTRFTRSDRMVGTAAYLSPEQVRGDQVGPVADVYALGLVLLECLTGKREYPGSEVETAVARLHRPPQVPDDLPPDLVRLLTLMTSLTPRRRPSAADCARALRTPTAILVVPQRERRKRTPLVAAGLGLVAAVATTAAVLGSTTSQGTAPPAAETPATSVPAGTDSAAPTATTGQVEQAAVVPTQTTTDDQRGRGGPGADPKVKQAGPGPAAAGPAADNPNKGKGVNSGKPAEKKPEKVPAPGKG